MDTPKIMNMDWKSLGYEKEYKDGKTRWVPAKTINDIKREIEESNYVDFPDVV